MLRAIVLNQNHIVTLDGPAGSGKSATARLLARALGYCHLDTGAMYRVVTLACLRAGIPLNDEGAVAHHATQLDFTLDEESRVFLSGEDVTEEIRSAEVSAAVSVVASNRLVREWLVPQQRKFAETASGVVAEGRDLATVVFPDARFQFYIDASLEERARRRAIQLREHGRDVDDEEVRDNLARRDLLDSTREHAPLAQAEGARYLDTTTYSLEEVVDILTRRVRESDEP